MGHFPPAHPIPVISVDPKIPLKFRVNEFKMTSVALHSNAHLNSSLLPRKETVRSTHYLPPPLPHTNPQNTPYLTEIMMDLMVVQQKLDDSLLHTPWNDPPPPPTPTPPTALEYFLLIDPYTKL